MPRLAFLGSPEVSAIALGSLIGAGHEITVVVTEPDRRRGRGAVLTPTPVKAFAQQAGIPVSDRVEDVTESGAELGVVVAFGRLIPPSVLARLTFVNLHFSLLPRWRGAAPVERAILAGDAVTGISLMQLDAGLDTGPVYAFRSIPIEPHEHAGPLRRRLAGAGAQLLLDRVATGLSSLGEPGAQVGEATYAAKMTPDERRIDWAAPAGRVERVVRVERAWTTWRGRRLIVWDGRAVTTGRAEGAPGELSGGLVATGAGLFELLEVQPEGRQRQSVATWLQGARPAPAERLGLEEPTGVEPPPS